MVTAGAAAYQAVLQDYLEAQSALLTGDAANAPAAADATDTGDGFGDLLDTEQTLPLTDRAPRTSGDMDTEGPTVTPTSRRRAARKAAPANTPAGADPRFANGPLAVVDDSQVLAYCVGGLVLDVPAKSIPALVDWTLKEALLGQPKLSGPGKDSGPLIVLTPSVLERYGLPVALTEEEQLAGRIPEGHKVIKQLVRAEWKLTKRGFGPWARIYRPAQGSERACVQLCIPSWHALDSRHWGQAGHLAPAPGPGPGRVRVPGDDAALHPPTHAVRDEVTGAFRKSETKTPGSLGEHPVDPAPCEAPDGHPLLKDLPRFRVRGPGEKLFEEAFDWARPLTDAECMRRNLVGIDVNMAFAVGADGLVVGLGEPTHVKAPVLDPKLPGSWLVDLSHVDLSRVKVAKDKWVELDGSLLPSPFTPKGEQPEGLTWYATPTVAYAVELGYDITPIEAYVRYDNGRYLDSWYNRLRDAFLATMADLSVHADWRRPTSWRRWTAGAGATRS